MEKDVRVLINLLLYWIVTLRDPMVPDGLLDAWAMGGELKDHIVMMNKETFETLNFIMKFFREVFLSVSHCRSQIFPRTL